MARVSDEGVEKLLRERDELKAEVERLRGFMEYARFKHSPDLLIDFDIWKLEHEIPSHTHPMRGWISGPIKCNNCDHKWVGVRFTETVQGLECPECGKYSGMEDV